MVPLKLVLLEMNNVRQGYLVPSRKIACQHEPFLSMIWSLLDEVHDGAQCADSAATNSSASQD